MERELTTPQYAYRVICPACLDRGAQVRIAYPFRDAELAARAVVVSFSCVNGTEEQHGTPSDTVLLALLADRSDVCRSA